MKHLVFVTIILVIYYSLCPVVLCQSRTDLLVITPSWLTSNSYFNSIIVNSGIQGVGEEMLVIDNMDVYIMGIPNRNIVAGIVPVEYSMLHHQNFLRWTGNRNISTEQYIDMSLLPGIEISQGKSTINPNLCGLFLISTLLEMDPAYFMVDSWYSYPWIREFYFDENAGLTREEMMPLFEDYGWEVQHPANIFVHEQCSDTDGQSNIHDVVGREFLCLYKDMMDNDYVPIVITDLSTSQGVLTPEKYFSDNVAGIVDHWVVVLQIIDSTDGFTYLRVYNPFLNREELYTWNNFYFSWVGAQEFKDVFYVKPSGI